MSAPLGERVAVARRDAGLTEKELATLLGISIWELERLEDGRVDPSGWVGLIAEITGRDPSWFDAGVRGNGVRSADVPVAELEATRDETAHEELPPPTTAARGLTPGEHWGRLLVLGSMTGLVVVR